ncbi:two-component system regulatory protein YycI [Paenibacillus marinisediminis]
MDWSRAKSILIYAFLLLNIVLGYQLWQDISAQMNKELDWTSLSEETRKIMDVKQISVTASIPSETPSLREITYRMINKDVDPTPMKEPVESKVLFMTKRDTIQEMEDEIPHIEMYQHDQALSGDGVFIMHQQMVNGLPLFEVNLELYYENQMIKAFRQQYAEIENSKTSEDQKILPASKALDTVIEKHLAPNSVVTDVKLGYHGQVFDTDTQVAAPSWRLLLENGDVYYMNAINGAVEHVPAGKKEK